jgi:hypothetical protein
MKVHGGIGHAGAVTQEEFMTMIRRDVFAPAVVESTLQPAGRHPHQALVTVWDWYAGLPERDKALVRHAMRLSAYSALFGFFAVIDGARAADDPPHGELRLAYIGPDGTERPLSGPGPDLDELHSLWSAEVFPFTDPLPD